MLKHAALTENGSILISMFFDGLGGISVTVSGFLFYRSVEANLSF